MLKSSANFSCSENQGVVEEMISTARLPFSLLFTSIVNTNTSATMRTRYKGVRLILKTMKLTILVILRLALILMYHCNLYWLLARPGGRDFAHLLGSYYFNLIVIAIAIAIAVVVLVAAAVRVIF